MPPRSGQVSRVVSRLRSAGCVFAEDEARLLLEHAADAAVLESLITAREAGVPLEHLLGRVDFCGLSLELGPGVFVPRQRTALLVRLAASWTPPGSVLLDLCCGCGAVAAAVAAAVRDLVVHACDIDPVAASWARRNLLAAADHGCVGTVHVGDLFEPLPPAIAGSVRTMTVNAPYVPTSAIAFMPPEARDHEPRTALDGGVDGVSVHRRIAAGARTWLAPGGRVLVETGARQARITAAAFAAHGFVARIEADDDLGATVVVASLGP